MKLRVYSYPKLIIRSILLMAIIIFIIYAAIGGFNKKEIKYEAVSTVAVHIGDSIWSIAEEKVDFHDIRWSVSEIKNLNPDINFNRIYPGDYIKIPVFLNKSKLEAHN